MNRKNRPILCCTAIVFVVALLVTDRADASKKLLRLRLDGPVLEAPADDMDLSVIFGGQKAKTLRQWINMIDKAAGDRDIHGIVMLVENPGLGLSQVEEFTRALKRFQKTGKKVYCYIDYAGNVSYALAAAADHITLAQYSGLEILGLHAELSYFKGLFEKIGVEADMMHCGDYKSALEPFTRTEPSKEAAEQINWLLDGLFGRWQQLIADGRGLSPADVKAAIDAAPLNAETAEKRRLVDAVASFADFKQMIKKEYGQDVEVVKKYPKDKDFSLKFDNPFALIETISKLFEKTTETAKPGIGLIYIEGAIVTGPSGKGMLAGSTVGSTTIRAAFEKARQDDNIKAVVVRVNSPGGSALASDIIWVAETRCAKVKPLVVSMGNVAGSGGYYVAIPGDMIFAEESTITGSIGVVGGKFVTKGLFEDKLGITTTEFDRGKNAGLMSMNRRWNDSEREHIRRLLYEVYDQFKGRVIESRGDRIKGDLEPLAGGRVYTGRQALEHGLVDRIGGLYEALEYAAEKADLDDYEVYVLPKKKGFEDILMTLLGEETEDEWEIGLPSGPTMLNDPILRSLLPILEQLDPERLRSIVNGLRNIMILNREHVGVFMPFEMRLR